MRSCCTANTALALGAAPIRITTFAPHIVDIVEVLLPLPPTHSYAVLLTTSLYVLLLLIATQFHAQTLIHNYRYNQGRIQRRGHATHYDRTYSSNFVSETGYAKNRIQYTDVNKWAVLFTEL